VVGRDDGLLCHMVCLGNSSQGLAGANDDEPAIGFGGLIAADLVAAIPGPPFRKTDAGWLGWSVQAARTLQAERSATVIPLCRPRLMCRPRNQPIGTCPTM
jgi:hypothetical protein